VLPGPAVVDVTATLLFWTPAPIPATFTDTVHDALAARVAPERLTELMPATAVAVPRQLLLNPPGVATTSPAGKLSVKATPVSAMVLTAGLARVNVREVVAFSGRVAAPNAWVIAGGAATISEAEAVLPVPPWVDETVPVIFE
jgi:hypothetical protein